MIAKNFEPYKYAAAAYVLPRTFAVNAWKGRKTQFKSLPRPRRINWQNPKVVALVKRYLKRFMLLLTRVDCKSVSPFWKKMKMISMGKQGYYDRVLSTKRQKKASSMAADGLATEFAGLSFD